MKPRTYNSDDPVIVLEGCNPNDPFQYMRMARLAGVALIWDVGTERFTHVGRRSNVGKLLEVWPRERYAPARLSRFVSAAENVYEFDIRGTPRPPAKQADIEHWEGVNIALLKVQHRVCEVELGFRIMTPGPPEVKLQPAHGGRRLGGVVWQWETYLTPQGRKFLQV